MRCIPWIGVLSGLMLADCSDSPPPIETAQPAADGGPQFPAGNYPIDGCTSGFDEVCATVVYGQAAGILDATTDLLAHLAALGRTPASTELTALVTGFDRFELTQRTSATAAVFRWIELMLHPASTASNDFMTRQSLAALDADANHCEVALNDVAFYFTPSGPGTPGLTAAMVEEATRCVSALGSTTLRADVQGNYTPYFALVPLGRGVGVRLLADLTGAPEAAAGDLQAVRDMLSTDAARLRAAASGRCQVSPTPPVCSTVSRRELSDLAPALDRLLAAMTMELQVLTGP